jgi:hypothetical protein
MHTKLLSENLKGGDHLQDVGADGRIRKQAVKSVAQDRHQWRGIVNTVMNLRLPYRREIFGLAERLLAFQGLCSIELVKPSSQEDTVPISRTYG